MTQEERKALVERLRDGPYTFGKITGEMLELAQAADQIEADGQRIAELEAEIKAFIAGHFKIEVIGAGGVTKAGAAAPNQSGDV